jgi:hypothetical protein
MAILQPSREALEGISPVNMERCKLSSEKEKSANVLPCCPDSNFGMPFFQTFVSFLVYIMEL